MAVDAEGKKRANGQQPQRLRVLVVGEHKILAEGIKAALEQHGVEVLGIAPNGDGVVSALSLGLPDAVVLCMWTQDGGAARMAAPANGRADAGLAVFEGLTPRELQVLGLLVEGASNKDMAKRLSIRSNTVRTHVQNLLAKLRVHTRLEAVTVANRRSSATWPHESTVPAASTPAPAADWAVAPLPMTGSEVRH